MTNQQIVYEAVKWKGDCIGKFSGIGSIDMTAKCEYCPLLYREHPEPPDLTTPEGAFWIMKRLPKWDRFMEFYVWLHTQIPYTDGLEDRHPELLCSYLKWIASDAKDGKAPALFNTLCEFMGLEVEG
jgi:hypothetical protein